MSGDSGLFDEPGPRGRRIIRIVSVVALLAIAGLAYVVVDRFAAHGQLDADKWDQFGQWGVDRFLLTGLGRTLESAAVAAVATLVFGLILALGRLSRHRWLSWLSAAYIEVFRSVPLLVLVLISLFVLPDYGVSLSRYWELTLPMIVGHSAGLAEVYRAGILSVERGQSEAAYSIGLRHGQTMRIIVLPQAIRRLLPAIVSQLVALLKGTSLGYIVSYGELLYAGKTIGEFTQSVVQTYLVIALIYAVMNGALSWLARRLELRGGPRRRRGGSRRVAAATDVALLETGAAPRPPQR